ncbi:fibronectin type III domain-containing protein, partial [Nonomuraea candida]|uniref:fibronectin type III domain-containing protein n=1 Tax=Nonomuraea candida TaxID=359159 RepID=UPI0005B9D0EE
VKVGDDQTGTTFTFAGLVEGRTYLIEVDAAAADGRSDRLQLQVTTPDVTPPAVPAGLEVTGRTRTTLTVSWSPASDNVSVAGYGVYLDGVAQGGDQTATSHTFTGLVAGRAYVVEVDAADPSGNRSSRAQATGRTAPDHPPAAPPNLRATSVDYTTFSVAWDEASDEDPVTGYDVALDGDVVIVDQPERTATFEGLVENTDHQVRVWAVDAIGQRTQVPAELIVRTLDDAPPTAPVLTVEAGEETITVAWTSSTDDFGVVGYRVDLDGQPVHSTPGMDYTVDGPVVRRHTVTGLTAGVDYAVRVAALDVLSQESADNTVTVSTRPVAYMPIESPVYRIGSWAGNVRDQYGVDWVVEEAKGWSSTPPVRPRLARLGGVDGAWEGRVAPRAGGGAVGHEGPAAGSRLVGVLVVVHGQGDRSAPVRGYARLGDGDGRRAARPGVVDVDDGGHVSADPGPDAAVRADPGLDDHARRVGDGDAGHDRVQLARRPPVQPQL